MHRYDSLLPSPAAAAAVVNGQAGHLAPVSGNGGGAGDAAGGSSMDVPRIGQGRKRRNRRILWIALALLAVGAVTFALARLQPAAPGVERANVWIDTVKRGPLMRQVRGLGALVPEEIRWIAARTEGRVDRIVIWPGTAVTPDSVLLVLSNPELEQSALDADAAVTGAQAKLVNLKAQLESQALERQAALAKAQGDRDTALAQVEVNERLNKDGLIAPLELKKSRIAAKVLADSFEIEKQRVDFVRQSIAPQLAVAENDYNLAKAQAALRHSQLDALQVRAGMNGVLQQVPVEVGQRVTAGTNLARVADPTRLKAQIKIAETQAKDIQPGQTASIDTRNGVVAGRVARVDPAVTQGTVLVDVTFAPDATLPRGARPDLSVEGTIELERLADVLYVGRPAFGQEESIVGLFKISPDGKEATRVRVRLGRGSVSAIEVKDGLQAGDRVILSDTTAFDAHERVRLQ